MAMMGRTKAASRYPPTINGPRRAGRSASRPATSFTRAAAPTAAPSSAPNASAPPPSTPVMNAGRSGYTISLAKSLRRETAPSSLTWRGRPLPPPFASFTQAESPPNQGDGKAAVGQHGVVKRAQRELGAAGLLEVIAQSQQLAPADRIAQLICRPRAVAPHLGFGVAALDVQLAHHLIHGLIARHAARVQADVEQNAHRAPQQVDALEKELFVRRVEALFAHHVFAVQRPALDGERRPQILADVRRLLFADDELAMMAGIAFVQGGGGQLVAAVVAQNPLLLVSRQTGIRHCYVEPPR